MKKYGYVLEMREQSLFSGFYQKSWGGCYAGPLRSASVFSRKRACTLQYNDETVRKVELFKNGKPKRVVKL